MLSPTRMIYKRPEWMHQGGANDQNFGPNEPLYAALRLANWDDTYKGAASAAASYGHIVLPPLEDDSRWALPWPFPPVRQKMAKTAKASPSNPTRVINTNTKILVFIALRTGKNKGGRKYFPTKYPRRTKKSAQENPSVASSVLLSLRTDVFPSSGHFYSSNLVLWLDFLTRIFLTYERQRKCSMSLQWRLGLHATLLSM